MKVKLLVFAAALLMLTSLSFGQNFVACIGSVDFVLTEGGAPVADGTPVCVYYDANSNGPDAADVLVTVCNNPPDCPDGPPGTYNYACFPGGLNGESIVGIPGTFVFDPCFTSSGITPSPARYWLKVGNATCPPGFIGTPGYWQSVVMTFVIGPQEYWLQASEWTYVAGDCHPDVVPCTYSGPEVVFIDTPGHPGARDITLPISLCTDHPCALVKVGPLGTDQAVAATRVPHVVLSYGGCDLPGSGWTWTDDYAGWVLVMAPDGQFWYQKEICIGSGTQGCGSLHFDFILAVNVGNVAITPSDNSVIVKFNTFSENDLARFEVVRDGHVVGALEATNGSVEHNYTYTDNTALNGTTYNYSLVAVSVDGSRNEISAATVTPSMDKAVVTEYALHQNFPNPFNPTTSIRFDLVEKNFVTLKVYNAMGQEVATVMNGERPMGVNIVNFDATNLTSGLYFYTLKVGNVYSATKKMLLVK